MQAETLMKAIESVNGASFLGLDTETAVTLPGGKKNPLQGRVTKRTLGSQVMCFQNKYVNGYASMVRRRLEQEGKDPDSFKLSERVWGTRLPELPLVEHKGALYLEVIFMHPGTVEYLLDGNPVDKKTLNLPEEKVNEKSQGGLDNKVIIRTYAADSITALRINGTVYR